VAIEENNAGDGDEGYSYTRYPATQESLHHHILAQSAGLTRR